MADPPSALGAFIAELQRRRVTRTLIGYGVVAFGAIQLVDPVVANLALPAWVAPAVVVAALAGFPVVAVLSWAFEVGPGAKPRAGEPLPRAEGSRAMVAKFVLALVVVGGTAFAGWRIFQRSVSAEPRAAASTPDTGVTDRLAVLPFENLSADADVAFFTDGLHDEIITQFTKLGGVRVIDRQAVRRFRNSEMATSAICAELGCRYVLSARVQRAADRIVVRTQLVDANVGSTLWAEAFEADLAEVFQVQRDVATRVVAALGLELTPEEQARIAAVPTADPEAYDAYLRARVAVEAGLASFGMDRTEHWRRARDELAQAVRLDPDFAVAWAELAMQNLRLYWWNWGPASESVADADEAIRRATELAADLPQLHLVRAQRYLWVDVDPTPALAEARAALRALPGERWAHLTVGGAERRLGNFEEAVRAFGSEIAGTLGEIERTRRGQRSWPEVWAILERRAERGSPRGSAMSRMIYALDQTGDTARLRASLTSFVDTYGEGDLFGPGYFFWLALRDYRKALEILEEPGPEWDRFHQQWGFEAKASHRARLYSLMGMADSARHHAAEAVRTYRAERDAFVGSGPWHATIAPDLARLGRRAEALAHADSALAFGSKEPSTSRASPQASSASIRASTRCGETPASGGWWRSADGASGARSAAECCRPNRTWSGPAGSL